MELLELNKQDIEYIYNTYMVVDFPKDELKSLKKILRCTDEGIYKSFGIYVKEKLVGYAFCIVNNKVILLDYFAILKNNRQDGFGSKSLNLMREYFKKDFDTFILESEDIECFKNLQDKEVREKRIKFYVKNGCEEMKFKSIVYGVNFVIFTIFDKVKDTDKLILDYKNIYASISSAEMCEKNIKIIN